MKENNSVHLTRAYHLLYMTESLKPDEGFPDEFSIAASSNTLPSSILHSTSVSPAHTSSGQKSMPHSYMGIGKQPQPQPQASSSVTILPRPSPMGNKSIQQNTKWIHKPKEKEISNTPVMEDCTDIHPTLYSIKPEVMTLDINAVSKTEMTSQHVIRFRPKCPTSLCHNLIWRSYYMLELSLTTSFSSKNEIS